MLYIAVITVQEKEYLGGSREISKTHLVDAESSAEASATLDALYERHSDYHGGTTYSINELSIMPVLSKENIDTFPFEMG